MAASTSASKHVAFAEDATEDAAYCPATEESDDTDAASDSDDDFVKITTSEPESLATSDEEDAELLQAVLESAYSCNPSFFSKCTLDPAERSSLLLLDKDFLDSKGNLVVISGWVVTYTNYYCTQYSCMC